MKYKIFIFIFVLCLFPIKMYGAFTVPDDHIHSSSFGGKQKTTPAQGPSIPPPDYGQTSGSNFNSTPGSTNSDVTELSNNNPPAQVQPPPAVPKQHSVAYYLFVLGVLSIFTGVLIWLVLRKKEK